MSKFFAELTDINGDKHVAELFSTEKEDVEYWTSIIENMRWVNVQDDFNIQMVHVVKFKIIEKKD